MTLDFQTCKTATEKICESMYSYWLTCLNHDNWPSETRYNNDFKIIEPCHPSSH